MEKEQQKHDMQEGDRGESDSREGGWVNGTGMIYVSTYRDEQCRQGGDN